MKRIAVLTSGGDAPGMNAAVRAVVRYGMYLNMQVFGVERGYLGLIENKISQLNMRSVSDTLQRGGTKLKTARCPEFLTLEGREIALKNLKEHKIDGLVVIGGDGTFKGGRDLCEMGFPTVGVPATIDNDLAYTDYTIGFDTACNTALDAINKLRDTISSHERVNVVEVMGRHCGDLALYVGLGGGAEVIILPEFSLDIDKVCAALDACRGRNKNSAIVVLAEGAGKAEDVARSIKCCGGFSVRSTVLGHIQRGGNPSMQDRLLANYFAVRAVELLNKGIGNRVIGIKGNKVIDQDITEALKLKKVVDENLLKIANVVSL